MKKKILISGAGPAGLMTAMLLDQNKYEIKVVERAPKFIDMGYSIILWQKGFSILLKAIGKKSIKKAYPLDRFTVYGGEKILPLQHSDTKNIGHSIKREDLMRILSKKFLSKWGKKSVSFSSSIMDIEQLPDKAVVRFMGGATENFDLVILADGMHSLLRSKNFKTTLESMPYKIKYTWIKKGSKLKNEGIIGFMQGYVFLIQTVGKDALLAYYTHANNESDENFVNKLKAHFEKERQGKFNLNNKTAAIFSSEEVKSSKPYNGRVVLVGDSYHGHPPTLAMGTSMAFEDADVLTQLLNQNTSENYEKLFEEYKHSREKVIRSIYNTQKFIEKLTFTDSKNKVLLSEVILKYGGWKILEPVLRKTFSS